VVFARFLVLVVVGDHINVTEVSCDFIQSLQKAQEMGMLAGGVFRELLTLSVSEIGTTANLKIFLYQKSNQNAS
jgi:hypothetical protein